MGTREDWVLEQERRKLLQDQIVSERKKEKFIKDIKSGLGNHIKYNGGRVHKIKKSRVKRFWDKLMKIF